MENWNSKNMKWHHNDVIVVTSHLSMRLDPYKLVHVPNFGGLSRSEDRGGGDNSIQLINFGRMSDNSFEEWRQKIVGWQGGWRQYFDLFVLLYWKKCHYLVYFYTSCPVH